MIRLFTWFVSFLKLLIIGKWYPPGYVRDVSAEEFNELKLGVAGIIEILEGIGRQTETTRKKVYRDEKSGDGGGEEAELKRVRESPVGQKPNLSNLQAGDEVPANLL